MRRFVIVREFVKRFDAETAKSILDSRQIPAVLDNDELPGRDGRITLGPGDRPNRVLVPREHLEAADRALADNGL